MAEDTATVAKGTVTGATKGAAVGTAIMPGVGTVVGAVIGGVLGFVQGIFSSQASRNRKKARNEEGKAAARTQALQRRNLYRDLYQKRADAVAAAASQDTGGLQSSLGAGGIGNIDSQGQFNIGYFDSQVASQRIVEKYLKKAANYTQNAGIIDSVFDAASSVSGAYGDYKNLYNSKLDSLTPIQVTAQKSYGSAFDNPDAFFSVPKSRG